MDHFDLGSAPSNERCAQLGIDADYPVRVRRECQALINQFIRKLGIPPLRARFRIMGNQHDFGTYYSVIIEFDPTDSDAVAYAELCDEQALNQWDAVARMELDPTDRAERDATGREEQS